MSWRIANHVSNRKVEVTGHHDIALLLSPSLFQHFDQKRGETLTLNICVSSDFPASRDFVITRMITDRIGLHSVLLPLLIWIMKTVLNNVSPTQVLFSSLQKIDDEKCKKNLVFLLFSPAALSYLPFYDLLFSFFIFLLVIFSFLFSSLLEVIVGL